MTPEYLAGGIVKFLEKLSPKLLSKLYLGFNPKMKEPYIFPGFIGRAIPHSLDYYVISLEDGSEFITHYTNQDFLSITESKLNKWNNG